MIPKVNSHHSSKILQYFSLHVTLSSSLFTNCMSINAYVELLLSWIWLIESFMTEKKKTNDGKKFHLREKSIKREIMMSISCAAVCASAIWMSFIKFDWRVKFHMKINFYFFKEFVVTFQTNFQRICHYITLFQSQ